MRIEIPEDDPDIVEFKRKQEEGAKRFQWAKPIVEAYIPEERRRRLPFIYYVPIAEAIEKARQEGVQNANLPK